MTERLVEVTVQCAKNKVYTTKSTDPPRNALSNQARGITLVSARSHIQRPLPSEPSTPIILKQAPHSPSLPPRSDSSENSASSSAAPCSYYYNPSPVPALLPMLLH